MPDDVEYQPCGTIWVAAEEDEMIEVCRKRDYCSQRGVPTAVPEIPLAPYLPSRNVKEHLHA